MSLRESLLKFVTSGSFYLMETSFLGKKIHSNSLVSARETFFWIEHEMPFFFCYFQKIFVRCVWDFCFDQEVAHQTTEISKRPCSAFPKEIKKKWFRKFIPSSISSATSSKPRFTKPDSPRRGCCLSLFNYYFAFLFCCSLTRLS